MSHPATAPLTPHPRPTPQHAAELAGKLLADVPDAIVRKEKHFLARVTIGQRPSKNGVRHVAPSNPGRYSN
jgi:hypothetical protein